MRPALQEANDMLEHMVDLYTRVTKVVQSPREAGGAMLSKLTGLLKDTHSYEMFLICELCLKPDGALEDELLYELHLIYASAGEDPSGGGGVDR